MLLGAAGQKQRRAKRVSVHRRKGDIVDENVVDLSFRHRDFPLASLQSFSKCEFGFYRKGLSWGLRWLLKERPGDGTGGWQPACVYSGPPRFKVK